MEVCGSHTMSIAKSGIRSLLNKNIEIISGPGCPVCVTSASDIHTSIEFARDERFIVTTFGDMLKIPIDNDSLQNYKSVKVLYNPLESLKLAKDNPDKEVVLLGIGFETTTPTTAAVIKEAKKQNIKNFSVISMSKVIPAAMEVILSHEENNVDALLLPGHVSAITGRKYHDFIKKHGVSGVVAGFDPLDLLEAIYLLVKNHEEGNVVVLNNYERVVSEDGNKLAMETLFDVFEIGDTNWRGIGVIPETALHIKDEYKEYDAVKKFDVKIKNIEETPGCICGLVLMGRLKPTDCKHYGKTCVPSNPIGPCMVSSEGTCAAYYKYITN